jgi:hypothetical protein
MSERRACACYAKWARGTEKEVRSVAQVVKPRTAYNKQEWRASPLHRTANRKSEAAAKKEKHFEFLFVRAKRLI